ncbi:hypothetical protein [Micrococcus sp.]|uniref:GNAT family N-acetyltransferase n=1 Tax=Micrococcus sp. TaxID=1271 RepID=UPI002A90DFAF|nr:hypothetical protein [Micrococcus sp.]MDY6055623.1 hypothetical protein [Micrococcus sp.]
MSAAPLDDHVRHLVALAWGRRLGLPDQVLADLTQDGGRLDVPADEPRVTLLRLGTATVLRAPEPVLRAAADQDPEVLALETVLLRLSAPWGPRSRGEQVLLHLEEPPPIDPAAHVAVSHDPAHVAEVLRGTPADDVAAAGMDALHAALALVPDDGHGHPTGPPVAAAGHTVEAGLLADLRAIVRPEVRGRGLGAYTAAVAADLAWTEGLVPQVRAPAADPAAQRTALAAGFVPTGTLLELELTRPD